MSEVALCLVSQSNIGSLASVEAGVFDEPFSPERIQSVLADANHLLVVAIWDAVVVGQVLAMVHLRPDQPPEMYVENMGVADPWLRQGVGGRLLAHVLELGRARGCERAWLATDEDNLAAVALYRSRAGVMQRAVIFDFDLMQRSGGDEVDPRWLDPRPQPADPAF